MKNYRGHQSIRKRNLHQNGFSSTTFEIMTAFFLWTLILGGVFCDCNNYWGLVLSWSCSPTRSCWYTEAVLPQSSLIDPLHLFSLLTFHFNLLPAFSLLNSLLLLLLQLLGFKFQFNLYLSEYSRAKCLCCIRIISIKKKIFKQISTFPLLYLNFHCIS